MSCFVHELPVPRVGAKQLYSGSNEKISQLVMGGT